MGTLSNMASFNETIIMSFEKAMESGPWANRTPDQRIKSPLLYRTELTAHICHACQFLVTLLGCGVKRIMQGYGTIKSGLMVKMWSLIKASSSLFGG
jgi:hypothetical protein